MDDRFDRLETAIQSLATTFSQRFDGIDARMDEMRAQLKVEIESVRDDIRIFAEAHVALEQRVTTLEQCPR